jgi:IMP cyclohydrolase
MPTLNEIAERNLKQHLVDNPCRGLVVGLSEAGVQTQISWIMGRSENSQNRVYTIDNSDLYQPATLKTEAADPTKVKDPSLIIYNVMRSFNHAHVVSNGDQTDTVIRMAEEIIMDAGKPSMREFFRVLLSRHCEPDAPNFTPRITGFQDRKYANVVGLSVLKAEPFARAKWIETEARIKAGEQSLVHMYNKQEFPTIRDEFVREVRPGFGYMLTTYMPGSKELPSFQGEPLLVPLRGSLEDAMQTFWQALEPSFRVAVGGREITKKDARYAEPINRFTKA